MGTAYIMGPLKEWDIDTSRLNYEQAERELKEIGINPLNPFGELYITGRYFEYINKASELMNQATCVYLLKGWDKCEFCKSEYDIAQMAGVDIVFQRNYHNHILGEQTENTDQISEPKSDDPQRIKDWRSQC